MVDWGGLICEGESDRHRCTDAEFALDCDRAVHRLDHFLDHRKAQARAGYVPHVAGTGEAVEDEGEFFGRNADAMVVN